MNNAVLGGFTFIAMDLDISINASTQSVNFIGNFSLPIGTVTSNLAMTVNSDGTLNAPRTGSLTLSGTIDGSDVSGSVACTFSPSGVDSAHASIHVEIHGHGSFNDSWNG